MRLIVILVAAVAGVLVAAAPAAAYPRFQLATGAARCQDCHVSPGGGGLLVIAGVWLTTSFSERTA